MYDEKLIQQIVEDIYRKIKKEQNHFKEELYLISRDPPDHLVKMLSSQWTVKTKSPDEELDLSHISNAVFFDVGQDLLVKGAIGIADTAESQLFHKLIQQGAKISFLLYRTMDIFAGEKKYAPSVNETYFDMLSGYIHSIRKYGVTVLKSDQIKLLAYPEPAESKPFVYDKKLLGQRDVEKWTYSSLLVSKHTIVTPLARDTAKTLSIDIRKMETGGDELNDHS
ncbi:hypothetical protein [Evansella clarkii]|uniref:hypothetical protein n=1 Tax=Evansella clarkii TaxID=79879 RepID=UPI000B43674B|nr:hypothetical protein [Evansella clarkii]